MALKKAVINSRTTGKFRRARANDRAHVVVNMVPIVGDTVMNSILYPNDEVTKSYEQLANLPAPAGHPEVEGKRVSAYHPMAVNAHNIGGFVRNPTKQGRPVRAEFWLDEDIANQTADGKETLRRIEAGESVGVSTGLNLRLVDEAGTGPDGMKYTYVGHDFTFDHVAILLNDTAAGAHAGTELITNDTGEKIIVATVDNVTASELHEQVESAVRLRVGVNYPEGEVPGLYIRDLDIDESFAVYVQYDRETDASKLFRVRFERTDTGVDIIGDAQEVLQVTTYTPVAEREPPNSQEDDEMDLTIEKVTEFLAGIGQVAVNAKEHEAHLAVNAEEYAAYLAAKPGFDAWNAEAEERVGGKREELVKESGGLVTKEMAANMLEPGVDAVLASLKSRPATADNRLRGGGGGGGGGGAGGGAGGDTTTADCQAVIDGTAKGGE